MKLMPDKKLSKSKKSFVPGSRVPISFLLDYLREGHTIFDFISAYPWIGEKKVKKALDEVKKREFVSGYGF